MCRGRSVCLHRPWLASAKLRKAADVEIFHVRGNIYILGGAGPNITISIGKDGVFMVDSGRADMADKILAAIKRTGLELAHFRQPVNRNEGGGGSGTVLTS